MPAILAPGAPELRERVAELAGQVRALRRPAPDAERILEAAERAAAEIRASAHREAERIRSQPPAAIAAASDEDAAALLAAARRQRHTLAVIAAEIERIEDGAAVLRTQLRALEGELTGFIELLSAPSASPGTSRRPPE